MDMSLKWLNRWLTEPVTAAQAEEALTAAGFPIEEEKQVGSGSGADTFLDVEVTSNRGDCLSHRGLAREVAAQLGTTGLKPADANLPPEAAGPVGDVLTLENTAPDLCPRFTARVIRGVKVGPSPQWLVDLLEAIGQRSINNVVDVTNFITHDLGHPCHVFDLAKLAGAKLVVRRAEKDEKLRTLDDKDRTLRAGDLVVADAEKPTSLAGVIGGADSEVTAGTADVVLEMATWDPVTVRHARRGHVVSTDAAFRFERGVSPLEIPEAAAVAAKMIVELAGGKLCQGVLDEGGDLPEKLKVGMRPSRCNLLTGMGLDEAEMLDLLGRLEMSPERDADRIACVIPAFRGDLHRGIDLIEEVARTKGLDSAPLSETIPVRVKPLQDSERAVRAIGSALTGAGFYETVTFSFCSPGRGDLFTEPGTRTVAVADDRRKAEPTLRPSALTGLLGCRRANQDARVEVPGGVRLFERSAVFAETAVDGPIGETKERQTLSLLVDCPGQGAKRSDEDMQAGVRLVRGAVEAAAKVCFGPKARVDVRPTEPASPGWRAGAFGAITINGAEVGRLGLISDKAQKEFGIDLPVAGAEIDLEPLRSAFPPKSLAHALPAFPPIERDLSLVVTEATTWSDVAGAVEVSRDAGELDRLDGFGFVGTFRGKPVGAGKKSVTLRLRFRDDSRTLRHEEVDPEVDRLVARCKGTIGAEVRA